MSKTTFNNGKDLMPGDIEVIALQPRDPITQENTGPLQYRAFFGFAIGDPFNTEKKPQTKFYTAVGDTPEEATRDLVLLLKDHLDRAVGVLKA